MSAPASGFDSKAFLSQLTSLPGVYRMYDDADELLYVGKARNLKKRVASYFLRASGNVRTEAMVAQIRRMEVTLTSTEDAALLLEASMIKELRPRYNVMFRDDKSYPMLRISTRHAFPRISFYRGGKEGADHYYGPFPSAGSVREMLQTLQKLFQLRPCTDTFFANRKRPCLQHQIHRCSGPCAGLIQAGDYARDLARAERLLDGRSDELVRELGEEMEQAAEALDFERAARVRDQIASFRSDRDRRAMTGDTQNADVFAIAPHGAFSCVVAVSVRDGVNLGHGAFFPRHPPETEIPELIASFIAQYYLDRPVPADILVGCLPADLTWLQNSLTEKAGRKVRISKPARGARLRLLAMTENTARQSLSTRLIESSSMDRRLEELQEVLDLERLPQRMECFDISHTRGERAVASCVVFNEEGPLKIAYRKFNIDGITPGDDYAAIRQAVLRRYTRVKAGEVQQPDVLFIDGGKGQLSAALEALEEIGFTGMQVVGIAKGPTRKPGLEQLIIAGRDEALVLPPDSSALHLIQRIRDEAHRFAITGHRARREKARITSDLESIEGLGPARRRALLKTLGGLPQIRKAGVDQLAKVEGISQRLAERIYARFH